jgi:hypothetical protein
MRAQRILQLDAAVAVGSGLAMLITRNVLYTLFGLGTPLLLDVIAIGLLGYGVALIQASRKPSAPRSTLMTFVAADITWVLASIGVLLVAWSSIAPLGRVLIIGAALVVEVMATLKFRTAGGFAGRLPEVA